MKRYVRRPHILAPKKFPKHVKAYRWDGTLSGLKRNISKHDLKKYFMITKKSWGYKVDILAKQPRPCYWNHQYFVIIKSKPGVFWTCTRKSFKNLYQRDTQPPKKHSKAKFRASKKRQAEIKRQNNEDQNYHAIQDVAVFTRGIYYPDNIYTSNNLADQVKRGTGVDVLYTDYDQDDAYVRWNRQRHFPEIVISRSLNDQQMKFALAHELGHLFIDLKWYPKKEIHLKSENNILFADHAGTTTYLSNDLKPRGEDNANTFTGELLMPAKKVRRIYHDLSSRVQNNFNLAKIFIASIFDVPQSTALIRLNILKMHGQLK